MLFLTDEKPLARWAAENQIACIGAAAQEDGFFDGADLVVEQPELLTRQEIEEYLAHYHGIPVVIARTEHLLLREICPADFERLHAISMQAGMETARSEANGESGFEADRLEAYITRQYRMYGYGLWSVLLSNEREGAEQVIGCCGFSECSSEVLFCEQNVRCRGAGKGGIDAAVGNAAGNCASNAAIKADEVHPQAVLELQYMLDEEKRRRGYGTEMCRAALDYGYQWLEAEAVWVRVKKENTVGVKFAQSLGFRICRTEEGESELWMRHEKECQSEEGNSELWMRHEKECQSEEGNSELWMRHERECQSEEGNSELWMRHEKECQSEEGNSELWMRHERECRAEEGNSELWMRHERECRAERADSEKLLCKRPGAEESGDCGSLCGCHDLEENNAV